MPRLFLAAFVITAAMYPFGNHNLKWAARAIANPVKKVSSLTGWVLPTVSG